MEQEVRVSRITMDRLVNLGNYEHVKYSITVDLQEGADPALTFTGLETILEALAQKGPEGYVLAQAKRILGLPAEDLSKYSVEELNRAHRVVQLAQEWTERQAQARDALRQLGGTVSFTDAKDHWEDR